jgi:probable F420-dependent oxidoreductase
VGGVTRFTIGLPIRRVGDDSAFGDPSFLRDAFALADEKGFWGVTAPDHIVAPNAWAASGGGEQWVDPFVLLGYAAAVTTRLRLITHIVVLPYRSPFHVAKAIASLDAISGGRAVLGVGSGYLREEFEILGVPFDDRGARTDEYLRAIRACWTTGDIDFDGDYARIHEARLAPQPVQEGGPPVWVGGNSERALRRAVELGDCWAPFDVADDDVRAGMARATRRVELALPLGRVKAGDDAGGRIDELRALGADYVKCGFAGRTPADWMANVEWFAAEHMS